MTPVIAFGVSNTVFNTLESPYLYRCNESFNVTARITLLNQRMVNTAVAEMVLEKGEAVAITANKGHHQMAKNRMTFEKTQRENKKRQKAELKRASRQARKDQAKAHSDASDFDTEGKELPP